MLRMDRRRGLGPLRQDGPQRHRIRRHAADLRGVFPAQAGAGPQQRRAVRRLRRLEPHRAGKLSDRNHARHLQREGSRLGRVACRQGSRHRPAKGDRQVDEPARARSGRADHSDHRGGLRALPVRPERGPRPRVEGAAPGRKARFAAIARRSSKTCGMPSTSRKFPATRRALCNSTRLPRNWAGSSTTDKSLCCGGAAASSALGSWKTSRRPSTRTPGLENLLLDDFFRKAITNAQPSWRRVVSTAVELGLPVPGFSAALSYYDAYRRDRLPANLLQSQRDYFGAHTYQRVDKPGTFHTDWLHAGKREARMIAALSQRVYR